MRPRPIIAIAAAALLLCLPCLAAGEAPKDGTIEIVEFRDIPLQGALDILSAQSSMNMVASREAARQRVSLTLRGVTPETALQGLCMANDLWSRRDEKTGIVRVATAAEYQRDLLSFHEEKTRTFTLLYPNAIDVAQAIRDLYGDRVRMSFGVDQSEISDELEERFDRFDLVDEQSQGLGLFGESSGSSSNANSNRYRRDSQERGSSRNASSTERPGGRSHDTDVERVDDLTVDEIRALEAEDASQAELVVDRILRQRADIFVTVLRQHNIVAVRTSNPATLDEIGELVERLDMPTPMVLLEVKILGVQLGDGLDSVFDYQYLSDEGMGLGEAGDFAQSSILQPDAIGELVPGVINGNMVFQYVDEKFRARVQMLERDSRVTELAAPMLLVANNEVSRVFVGEEVPLNRGFSGGQVVTGGDSTIVTPGSTTIEFRPVGTTLLITPNINSDRTVTLRLLQETSDIREQQATVLVPTSTGFEEQQVDIVQSNSLSGTVIARDRLAMAFGGLVQERLSDRRDKVPILGDIPVLGVLFRRQNTVRSRQELVVMVRPFVLMTPADAETVSAELVKDLSIHPKAGDVRGTLGTYDADDVVDPDNIRDSLLKNLDPRSRRGSGEERQP